jgi:hypothetical protein
MLRNKWGKLESAYFFNTRNVEKAVRIRSCITSLAKLRTNFLYCWSLLELEYANFDLRNKNNYPNVMYLSFRNTVFFLAVFWKAYKRVPCSLIGRECSWVVIDDDQGPGFMPRICLAPLSLSNLEDRRRPLCLALEYRHTQYTVGWVDFVYYFFC